MLIIFKFCGDANSTACILKKYAMQQFKILLLCVKTRKVFRTTNHTAMCNYRGTVAALRQNRTSVSSIVIFKVFWNGEVIFIYVIKGLVCPLGLLSSSSLLSSTGMEGSYKRHSKFLRCWQLSKWLSNTVGICSQPPQLLSVAATYIDYNQKHT